MSMIESSLTIAGVLFTCAGVVYGWGLWRGKKQVKAEGDAAKLVELAVELGIIKTNISNLSEVVRDLKEADALSTQKIMSLEGSISTLFKLVDKQGEKIEDFFNKIYEIKR